AEDLKSQGNKAFSSGDYETAIKFFSQAIDLDSSNHVLYSNRSAAYASLKDYEKALQDAEKTVQIKPDWAKGYSRKGAALYGLQKLKEASEAYKAGLKLDPNNALLQKGLDDVENAMMADGGMDDPMSSITKLFGPDVWTKIATNPKLSPLLANPQVVEKIKNIQANPKLLGMYMKDQTIMQLIMGLMGIDATFASPGDDSAMEAETPTSSPPPQRSAPSEPKKSEPTPAPKPEEKEEDLTEEEKEKRQKRKASDDEKTLGNQAYKQKKFEEALKHYAKAWELDDTNVAVLTNQSAVQFEMGKYDECIKTCEKAVDVGRELRADFKLIARAYGRMGNAYIKQDNYEEAIKYYNKSLAEHRTADVLTKLREAEKIKKERDRLAYINPAKSDEAREKGNELFKSGSFSEAVRFYTDAIKRNPEDPRNFSNRAACYMKLMALPEADKDCDEAIRLDPNFVKAYIRKAAILYAKRDYMKCMDLCNEAKEKDTEHKHTQEIEAQIMKCYAGLNEVQSSENREEIMKRAMADPEVQGILADPVMQQILQQMQTDPAAVKDHMRNPAVATKIRTLINAGILRVG
ncbi:Hsp90 cochaperone, partial [Quaeritorhiza haematococci]